MTNFTVITTFVFILPSILITSIQWFILVPMYIADDEIETKLDFVLWCIPIPINPYLWFKLMKGFFDLIKDLIEDILEVWRNLK